MKKGETLDLKLDKSVRIDRFHKQVTYRGIGSDFLNFDFYSGRTGVGQISVPVENADEGNISINGFNFRVSEYNNNHISMEYLGKKK